MSEEKLPQEFWDRADEVIALANRQARESSVGKVSSSLLYAASRFHAFNVASSAESAEALKKNRKEAVRFFVDNYQKMLEENLNDYLENFEEYLPGE